MLQFKVRASLLTIEHAFISRMNMKHGLSAIKMVFICHLINGLATSIGSVLVVSLEDLKINQFVNSSSFHIEFKSISNINISVWERSYCIRSLIYTCQFRNQMISKPYYTYTTILYDISSGLSILTILSFGCSYKHRHRIADFDTGHNLSELLEVTSRKILACHFLLL